MLLGRQRASSHRAWSIKRTRSARRAVCLGWRLGRVGAGSYLPAPLTEPDLWATHPAPHNAVVQSATKSCTCTPRQSTRIGFSGRLNGRVSWPTLYAAVGIRLRVRPRTPPARPLPGCRQTRAPVALVQHLTLCCPLCSAGVTRLPCYYGAIRLLRKHRGQVVSSFASYQSYNPAPGQALRRGSGPAEISEGKIAKCPTAAVSSTTPDSIGYRASHCQGC